MKKRRMDLRKNVTWQWLAEIMDLKPVEIELVS